MCDRVLSGPRRRPLSGTSTANRANRYVQVVYALPFRWIYVTLKKKQPPGMAGPKPKSSRLRVLQVVVQEALKRTQQFHTRLGARKPLALVR